MLERGALLQGTGTGMEPQAEMSQAKQEDDRAGKQQKPCFSSYSFQLILSGQKGHADRRLLVPAGRREHDLQDGSDGRQKIAQQPTMGQQNA
jgi:hypothetical protein